MKVIIIGPAWPYRGGLAAFNERLAQEYAAQGHDVQLVTFTLQYPSFLFPGKTQYADGDAPPSLRIRRMVSSVNPFTWLRTGRWLRREEADLVIFAYWMSFFVPCYAAVARLVRSPRTRIVGLVHNMMPHEPNILDRFLPVHFVRAMDAFIALSASVAEDIARLDRRGKPCAVSPHPMYDHYGAPLAKEDAARRLHLHPGGRYVLFFGFIRRYKGLDLLLEAMADERLRRMNVKLVVAGEFYEDDKPYLKKIEELGLGDRVILRTEFVPDGEVRCYFGMADIVAQPYRSATQSGVSQIAYHFEKPMLVTDVGGLPEIVPHGRAGYVVQPAPGAIADALTDFFSYERAEAFAPYIREEKKKYSWTVFTDRLDWLYKACRKE